MKTACIIGAAGGIGRVVAQQLWAAGYSLVLTSRDVSRLEPHEEDTRCYDVGVEMAADQRVYRRQCDVTDAYSLADLRHTIVEDCVGHLDLLVFCHGAAPQIGRTHQLHSKQFADVWHADVQGTVDVVRYLYPHLRAAAPSLVVIVGSFHALGTYPGRAPYAAAKTALLGLTRAWALEWGHAGIRCVYLAVGQVEGERTRKLAGADNMPRLLARSPTGRLVVPEDIGRTILWCASCPSVNGASIVLDHGWSASLWWGDYDE